MSSHRHLEEAEITSPSKGQMDPGQGSGPAAVGGRVSVLTLETRKPRPERPPNTGSSRAGVAEAGPTDAKLRGELVLRAEHWW